MDGNTVNKENMKTSKDIEETKAEIESLIEDGYYVSALELYKELIEASESRVVELENKVQALKNLWEDSLDFQDKKDKEYRIVFDKQEGKIKELEEEVKRLNLKVKEVFLKDAGFFFPERMKRWEGYAKENNIEL